MPSVRSSSGTQMLAAFDPASTFRLDNDAVVDVADLPDQDNARPHEAGQHHQRAGEVLEFVSCTQQYISADTMQQTCTEVRSDDEFREGHEWRGAAPRAV